MWSAVIKRIDEVNFLRNVQFIEDSSPMRHPIKPQSYLEINNFYTATVYRKGAEVIRMLATLIGKDSFRLGIDKYFELFDGQAVTTEDFVYAMELATDKDFTQFQRWYSQSGTPQVFCKSIYNSETKTYTLEFEQELDEGYSAYYFPMSLSLIDKDGKELLEVEDIVEIKEKNNLLFTKGYILNLFLLYYEIFQLQ